MTKNELADIIADVVGSSGSGWTDLLEELVSGSHILIQPSDFEALVAELPRLTC